MSKININRKKSREYIQDLEDRFLKGEKLTVEDIVEEYFKPQSPFDYLMVKKRVRNWITSVKRIFRREGVWFGNLDDEGRYGLISSMEEAAFAMIRYYRFVKGNINNANMLARDAKLKGFLPENIKEERMLLSNIIKEEENE